MDNKQSPCKSCTRVKDPLNCENKNCATWREWFSARWKLINDYYRKYHDKDKQKP